MNNLFDKLDEKKKIRIITSAIEEFSVNGYKNASTNIIVKKSGISKGSLFKYFKNKHSLYTFLVEYNNNKLIKYINDKYKKQQSWKNSILMYSKCEMEFLIQNPILISFYRQVIRDLKLEEFDKEAKDLLNASLKYFNNIFNDYTISNELMLHISFIVKGYNEYFYSKYLECNQDILFDINEIYIKGLKKHLDMIGDE